MTFTETAASMRRVADVMDRVVREQGTDADTGKAKPMLSEDASVGAAVMLTYLRDLITCGDRDSFDRPTLLVLLETISRDAEMFPAGVGQLIWESEDEEPR